MTDDFDFYDLLEIDENASQSEVKTAFRAKVQEYHPDLNDDPDAPAQFTAVNKAYEILKDPAERQAYDRLGHKDYVAKRTSGIPDPSAWKRGDDSKQDTSSGSSSAASGSTSTTDSSASRSSSRSSRSSQSSRSSSRSTGSSSRSSGSSSRSSGSSSRSSSSRSSGQSSQSSRSRDSTSERSSTSNSASNSNRRANTSGSTSNRSRSASSSAGSGASANSSTSTPPGGSSSASTVGTTSGGASTSSWTDNALFNWWRGLQLGWPLMLTSTLLFVVGAGYWVSASLGSFRAFASALAAAGTDTAALRAALVGRRGIPTLYGFAEATELVTPPLPVLQWYGALAGLVAVTVLAFALYRGIWAEHPYKWVTMNETVGVGLAAAISATLYGGPLLAGAVVMPFVFLVIIRHTRAAYKFKPTYGYVLGVSVPLGVIGVEYVVRTPPLAVDVAAVGLPVLSMLLLLFSAFVRPKLFD